MKAQELRDKNINELNKILEEKINQVQSTGFDVSVKQAKNHRELRNTKRDIARILTVIREKNNI
ncbi:MAG: 50S ribosomal protein L29 [Candidatus Moranbacteria bacterium]|jgi:large subunit ribosomal protein L29|nr:50S ribosomal protein L29 [Candidatus Moranbacteria bacterium]NCA93725.1 50S ribosomal protein L29 [Sphingobacteriia bacterium]NLC30755.1 50S ribosomal protein L29 [Candidatus Moranbacteria bacterium]